MFSSRLNSILERLRVFLKSDRLTAWLTGVLVGLFINLVTDSTVKSVADLATILSSGRLSSDLFLCSLGTLLLIYVLRRILEGYRIWRGDDALLARLLAARADPAISSHSEGVVAFGSALTLLLAPDLTEGWPLGKVRVRYSGDAFGMPPEEREAYRIYLKENRETKRFF